MLSGGGINSYFGRGIKKCSFNGDMFVPKDPKVSFSFLLLFLYFVLNWHCTNMNNASKSNKAVIAATTHLECATPQQGVPHPPDDNKAVTNLH